MPLDKRRHYTHAKEEHMKELDYFYIDGELGWNQNRFPGWAMRNGGCAAVTACDLCICLARQKRFSALYPFDPFHVEKQEYLAFSEKMKPYLHPRWQGIDTLELYLSGLLDYWRDAGISSLLGRGLPLGSRQKGKSESRWIPPSPFHVCCYIIQTALLKISNGIGLI